MQSLHIHIIRYIQLFPHLINAFWNYEFNFQETEKFIWWQIYMKLQNQGSSCYILVG